MKYFFITGEASGDHIAATVVNDLYKKDQTADIFYWGGPALRATSATALADIDQFRIMGFSDVIVKIGTLIKLFNKCKSDIIHINPDVIILVDFAGFNLRIAKWAKKKGHKIIYLSPPKTWASRPQRNATLKKYADLLIVLFPFEKSYFDQQGIPTLCFGHPMTQEIAKRNQATNIRDIYKLDTRPIVCLAPGSRRQEVRHMLPTLITFSTFYPQYNYCVSCAPGVELTYLQQIISENPAAKCTIVTESLSELLSISHCAFITSGTATFEAALLNVPQVVCYKTSWINYYLAKLLIKVRYISLVNLILNRKAVTELIQENFSIQNLKNEMEALQRPDVRDKMKTDYIELKNIMNTKDTFSAMASAIIEFAE